MSEKEVPQGWNNFDALAPEGRKQVFEETERRWTTLMNRAGETLYEIQQVENTIEETEARNADLLVRGGRSRSEQVERLEALKRLEMPEEVDGKKLSNEELRKAWIMAELAGDPNYIAAKEGQAEVEEELTRLRHHKEFLVMNLALAQAGMAHQDAVLGFFRKG